MVAISAGRPKSIHSSRDALFSAGSAFSPAAAARRRAGPKLPLTKSQFEYRDLEMGCLDKIIEVGKGGTFLKVHAKS